MTATAFKPRDYSGSVLAQTVHGGWGRMGSTHIRLAVADEDSLRGALHTAWKLRVEKNGKARSPSSRKGGKRA
jgi:hypothetical protein